MSDLRDRISTLPLPLAQLVRRAFSARSAMSRHQNAFFVGECALKLASAARIGMWLQQPSDRTSELATRLQAIVHPATGHWLEYLRECSRALGNVADVSSKPLARVAGDLARKRSDWPRVARFIDRGIAVGAMAEAVGKSATRRGLLGFFEALVAYRNLVIGHGGQRKDSFYDEFSKLLLDALDEVLASSLLFDGLELRLVRPEEHDVAASRLIWCSARGLAIIPTHEKAPALPCERLFLCGEETEPVPLYPLAVYRAQDETEDVVAFVNRVVVGAGRSSAQEVKRAEYLDYASGTQIESDDARAGLVELLSRLTGHAVADSDVAKAIRRTIDGDLAPAATDAEAVLAPGEVVANKYRVIRGLGAGGMGVVVLAEHVHLRERVALKVLHATIARHDEVAARFLREARSAARLRGEHVARATDYGMLDDGAPYLVMEYLEGTDLATVVARGRVAPATAVSYVLQACEGLAEAHAAGMVHRDIKPSNLFLTKRPDGSTLVKVLDFGIAKARADDPSASTDSPGALTASGVVMGSPAYMSPEQLRSSKDVTAQSDVWSLGVVLFELLTGHMPFEGETYAAIAGAILHATPLDPRSIEAAVDPELARVVLGALEKDATKRPATIARLAIALRPFASRDDLVHIERAARILGEPRSPSEPPGSASVAAEFVATVRADQSSTAILGPPPRERPPATIATTTAGVASSRPAAIAPTSPDARSSRGRSVAFASIGGVAVVAILALTGSMLDASRSPALHRPAAAAEPGDVPEASLVVSGSSEPESGTSPAPPSSASIASAASAPLAAPSSLDPARGGTSPALRPKPAPNLSGSSRATPAGSTVNTATPPVTPTPVPATATASPTPTADCRVPFVPLPDGGVRVRPECR